MCVRPLGSIARHQNHGSSRCFLTNRQSENVSDDGYVFAFVLHLSTRTRTSVKTRTARRRAGFQRYLCEIRRRRTRSLSRRRRKKIHSPKTVSDVSFKKVTGPVVRVSPPEHDGDFPEEKICAAVARKESKTKIDYNAGGVLFFVDLFQLLLTRAAQTHIIKTRDTKTRSTRTDTRAHPF